MCYALFCIHADALPRLRTGPGNVRANLGQRVADGQLDDVIVGEAVVDGDCVVLYVRPLAGCAAEHRTYTSPRNISLVNCSLKHIDEIVDCAYKSGSRNLYHHISTCVVELELVDLQLADGQRVLFTRHH